MKINKADSQQDSFFLEKVRKEKTFNFTVPGNGKLTGVIYLDSLNDISVNIDLDGPDSEAVIYILVNLKENGTVNVSTVQKHNSSHSTSRLYIKCLLSGKSVFNFHGLIRIEKNISGADAYQRNENLVLNDQAKVNSSPSLEILSNDVKCTHGAVTAPPDSDQIFYLKTRGIKEESAEKLISRGFLLSILDNLNEGKQKTSVLKKFNDWI